MIIEPGTTIMAASTVIRAENMTQAMGKQQRRKALRRDRKLERARGQEVPQRRYSFCRQSGSCHRGDSKCVSSVRQWLMKKESLDAAIWTELPGTYDRGCAIKYLKSIKDPARLARAREYVC